MPHTILLVISGSVAAYKALECARELTRRGDRVRTILTPGAQAFITPLSVAALTGEPVYTELFSLKDETEMGHIRLSREADAILIAPASADLIARLAQGHADDLASACLLATDARRTPVLLAPAMNTQMWQHPAVARNISQLQADGLRLIAPDDGLLACGEVGAGRLAELPSIIHALDDALGERKHADLAGRHVLVTGGATCEPLDPVRYLTNRSSGRQAVAIVEALLRAGAHVTFVHGHLEVPPPHGAACVHAPTATAMHDAALAALPADAAICAAAVSDWYLPEVPTDKQRKQEGQDTLTLTLHQTPDVLHALATHPQHRPPLVIGFAAETPPDEARAKAKCERKGCDWLLVTDVSGGAVFGQRDTALSFYNAATDSFTPWGALSKQEASARLVEHIGKAISGASIE